MREHERAMREHGRAGREQRHELSLSARAKPRSLSQLKVTCRPEFEMLYIYIYMAGRLRYLSSLSQVLFPMENAHSSDLSSWFFGVVFGISMKEIWGSFQARSVVWCSGKNFISCGIYVYMYVWGVVLTVVL